MILSIQYSFHVPRALGLSCFNLALDEGYNSDGRTPLLVAASLGHTNVVQLLLLAGADKDSVEGLGFRELQIVRVQQNYIGTKREFFPEIGAR